MINNKYILIIAIIIVIGVVLLVFGGSLIKITTSFIGTEEEKKIVDVNKDGKVDQSDIEAYSILFREKDIRADIDKNGQVSDADLAQYIALYRNK